MTLDEIRDKLRGAALVMNRHGRLTFSMRVMHKLLDIAEDASRVLEVSSVSGLPGDYHFETPLEQMGALQRTMDALEEL